MDIFTFLKFGGFFVSGALGILGTVSETKDKDGNLNAKGKWGLALTILGLAISLSAMVVEEIRGREAAVEARVMADAQRGFMTRFDTAEAVPAFELPATDARVKNFMADLDRMVAQSVSPNGTTNLPPGIFRMGKFLSIMPGFAYKDPKVVAFLKGHEPLINSLKAWDQACMLRIDRPSVSTKKKLEVRSLFESDLFGMLASTNSTFNLYYAPQSRRLLFEFPRLRGDHFTSNGKVRGITDLTGAKLTVSFSQQARTTEPSLLPAVRLVSCDMNFDDHACAVTNFTGTFDPGIGYMNFSATLPDAEAIFSGKTLGIMSFLQY